MIDRSAEPLIRPTEKPDFIQPQKVILNKGLPVYLMQAGTQDVCKIDFIFEAGTWQENSKLQAVFTNAMLQEGSTRYSSAQIAEVFDFHGAYLQLLADQHYGIISIISLTKHLPRLLPVVEDLLKHPTFPEHEFDSLVKRRKQRFLLENEKVKVLCQKKFSEMLFGEKHPYAQTVRPEDFDTMRRSSLIDFYHQYYHAGNCEIIVAGQFDVKLTNLLNQHFGGSEWKHEKEKLSIFTPNPSKEKLLHVLKTDAIQSAIRVGKILVKREHPDYLPLQVLVTILGGYFSSRLMTNIREEKGYTYGIGSNLLSLNKEGYLVIATEVDKSNEQATITEIFREINKLREEPVGEKELNRVQQYLLGEFVRDLDGPFALAQAFRDVHDFGLDYGFYDQYYQTLLHINPEQLQKLAQIYFQQESFYVVTAGQD